MIYKFQTNHSDITLFAECPSCHQLIKMKSFTDAALEGSRECPFCRAFIDKKEIIASCELNLKITKAMRSAGYIFSIYGILFVILGEILIGIAPKYLGDSEKFNFLFYLSIFISTFLLLGGFLMTRNWLSEFGKIQTADKEFLVTRKKVRQAQIVWVWANIVNAIWWFIYIRFL